MIKQKQIRLKARHRGFHLITKEVLSQIELPEKGLLHLFIQHTSAGISINENADPTVLTDFETIFTKLVPENNPDYTHTTEGADDMPAHIKSSLTGVSVTIPIENHHLGLGIWQGIYLCEFRNYGGNRSVLLTIYS